ncbi:hypothetical protein F5Y11DRAFT_342317 [Daldinia sp. FL1419]|nr:hypothetical protein F5Y11DRAFT_342317 [Daldinia sp. FL1419]
MSDSLGQRFIERTRSERQEELDRLARGKYVNLGFILGLSFKIGESQSHVDYVGGLDNNRRWISLAKSMGPAVRETKPGHRKSNRNERIETRSLRDALVDAAPVDISQNTAIERKKRSHRKYNDYAGILSHIDTTVIASFALNIMEARHRLTSTNGSPPPDLPQVDGPFFGSAHIFYSIEFFDPQDRKAAKWAIKIPINGTPDIWDELCAEALRAEALVLYMLRTETHVPVPAIIDADSSPYNELHVPYLIMEYVAGLTLDQVWFGIDEEIGEKEIRARRSKILQNLAQAMHQLGRYEFKHGGAPVFDDTGVLIGVGPSRELNIQAMVNRWLDNEDCERAPLYIAAGPFGDAGEMYTMLLDMYPCDTEASTGVDKLLRLLIHLIREPNSSSEPASSKGKEKEESNRQNKGFVLAHPCLSMRHIIVSKEGDIKAIVGWDGVHVAPRSRGNEAFPPWLVRDFDTFTWRWRPSPVLWRGKGAETYEEPWENRYEDAPWVLKELRDEYIEIIRRLKSETGGMGGSVDGNLDTDVDMTKQSLLALNLHTAARDPRCRTAILRRILEKCSRPSEKFEFERIVEVLGVGGHLNRYMLRCLERNFRELIDRGYVRGAVVW